MKKTMRKILLIIAGVLLAVGVLGCLGLQVRPQPFPPYPEPSPPVKMAPLPAGLPAPVERFYRTVYGEQVPVIETVVMTGRGTMKPFMNIPVPARFLFVHTAGQDYRHYFEATWFGLPLLKVDEGYLEGASFFESPMGSYYDEQNANQGANLALWAEAIWFPSLWLTDPRARWEPVDRYTARLYIPYEGREETFIVRFDPHTGLIDLLEAMRYRDLGQGSPKILWIVRDEAGRQAGETRNRPAGSLTWLDQGKPWAYFNLEELVHNVDVSAYIRARGW